MKSYPIFMLILLTACFSAVAADIQYPAASIPEELKKNADAVVRLHKEEFLVHSRAKATEKVHLVVTILNKNGSDYAQMAVHYDQLSKVKSLEGRAYDAAGEQIDKLKRKDIQDVSNFSSFSLFEDNRLKVASLEKNQYPYTVEWTYERETSNMMFYPVWVPQGSERLSVENASQTIEMPPLMKLRYLENALAPACKRSQQVDKTIYQWQVRNLEAVSLEPLRLPYQEDVPVVYTAPEEFEVDSYVGNMNSWENYGAWISLLNSNQNDLPEVAVENVKKLTAGLPDRKEKVKAIYDYLQENTRYVSIQLGIGGWQPFKTSFVHEKGYGDCKALSFYTKSLLEVAGIPSYYTLIYAGSKKKNVLEDFPIGNFNHAILCVPNEQDTIWLECTSQTNPFGYLGDFTSDRKALVITEEGGKVVKTPTYQQEENLQHTVAHVKLEGWPAAKVDLKRSYQGLQFENYSLSSYIHTGPDKQLKWVLRALKIPAFEVQDFSFALEEKEVPVATLDAQLLIRNFISSSGKRSFVNLNLGNHADFSYPTVKERKKEFFLDYPFIDRDTIVYHLPEGVGVEYLPEEIKLMNEFGEYHASAFEEEGKVIYARTFKLHGGTFPAEKYNEYVKFRQEIMKADKTNMVLLNP